MKVTFLYHSGFVVELEKHILIFDYYKGNLDNLNKDKEIYFFVSHSHYDHFNKKIFKYSNLNVHYILSNDCKGEGLKVEGNNHYKIDDIEIQTLLSNDEGVAYLIKVEDKVIFHAGDLNDWDWNGEDPKWLSWQHQVFVDGMKAIKDNNFDLMFIPLDIRLEDKACQAIKYIQEHMNFKVIIPMHCFNDLTKMNNLINSDELKNYQNIKHFDSYDSTIEI